LAEAGVVATVLTIRSGANWKRRIVGHVAGGWIAGRKPHGDRSAVIDADRFGAQIIATRLQLQ
jgi:hypothetical protein